MTMTCPRCGSDCCRDEADVGVGVIYGPWGCCCGWSEDDHYDVTAGPKFEAGYRVDQWGGLTPMSEQPHPRAAQIDLRLPSTTPQDQS